MSNNPQWKPPNQQPWQQPPWQQPPQYPPPPPPTPVRNRRGCLWLVGLIVVGLIIAGVVLTVTGAFLVGPVSTGHTIQLRVTGTGNASITYGTTSGTSQTTAPLPWSTTKTVDGFDVATVIANHDPSAVGTGELACQIVVDGVVKASETSSGEYATVTCSAGTT